MKARFDTIFFDNDGVLVDTEPLFVEATQEILATVGVELTMGGDDSRALGRLESMAALPDWLGVA